MASSASDREDAEPLPCGGLGNELGGCSHIYEFGISARTGGLCPRCKRYQEATTESEKSRIHSTPWCSSCGVFGPLVDDPCGACRRKLLGTDLVKASAAAVRADSLGRRVHANRPSTRHQVPESTSRSTSGSSANSNVGPSTPVEDLLALRGGGHSSDTTESTITIQWSIRLANATTGEINKGNGAMGTTIRALPQSTTSQHLTEYIIKESQITWKGANNMWPLRPEYCDLRGSKNSTFPEHGAETLLKMYAWQKAHNPVGIISNSSSRSKGSKSSGQGILVLELTVFMDKYTRWTGGNDNNEGSDEDVKGSRKRKKKASGGRSRRKTRRSEESSDSDSELLPPLTSKFVGEGRSRGSRRPSKGQEPDYTQIRFRRTEVQMEEDENEATLEVVEGDADESGWLCDLPLEVNSGDQGRSKTPFMFKIGDATFVAKEITNLGGKGKVTPRQAKDAVVDELKRLELARWALHGFKELARDKSVPLEPVDITAAFLATLIPTTPLESDVDLDNMDGDSIQSTGVRYFLVEPLRSTTAVVKFSGTLGSRVATDGLSGTINAFAHYAAQCFASRRVFCDIQGSFHKSASETMFILFDPMTHSITGDSGPGDHGVEGIKVFIDSHKCSQHCKRLALAAKARLISSAKAAAMEDAVDWPEDD